jgi:hypothetical protein
VLDCLECTGGSGEVEVEQEEVRPLREAELERPLGLGAHDDVAKPAVRQRVGNRLTLFGRTVNEEQAHGGELGHFSSPDGSIDGERTRRRARLTWVIGSARPPLDPFAQRLSPALKHRSTRRAWAQAVLPVAD